MFIIMLGTEQAGLGKLLPRRFDFSNGFDLLPIKARFMLIGFGIMRGKVIGRDTLGCI